MSFCKCKRARFTDDCESQWTRRRSSSPPGRCTCVDTRHQTRDDCTETTTYYRREELKEEWSYRKPAPCSPPVRSSSCSRPAIGSGTDAWRCHPIRYQEPERTRCCSQWDTRGHRCHDTEPVSSWRTPSTTASRYEETKSKEEYSYEKSSSSDRRFGRY
ncbi:hypothetical protein AAVH_08107 [Aphelenchoides avenae]|nr:hypothetical protein AAVH_08107 [Aphelenchus avenae]